MNASVGGSERHLARPIEDAALNRALREGAPDHLRVGIIRLLKEKRKEWERDWRDAIIDLAPYHDCARRLGLDPRLLFEWTARRVPEELAEPIRKLGKRTDVTPELFGFAVVEEAEGPRYYWTR